MGHSSITMTMDVYGNLFPDADDGKALGAAEQKLLTAVNAT
jgi:integrase